MATMQDFKQKALVIDDEKIVCEYKLADKNAVILHGAGQSQRKRYYAIAKELVSQGLGVIMFDFSGHGESTGKLEELSLAKRKKQASVIIDTIILANSPLYLVGFSMGAQTACDLLPTYGERIKGILLACPAIYRADVQDLQFGDSTFTSKLREPNSWELTKATKYLSDFNGKTVVAIGSEDEVIPGGVVSMLKASAKHLYFEEFEGASHAFASFLSEHPKALARLAEELVIY